MTVFRCFSPWGLFVFQGCCELQPLRVLDMAHCLHMRSQLVEAEARYLPQFRVQVVHSPPEWRSGLGRCRRMFWAGSPNRH